MRKYLQFTEKMNEINTRYGLDHYETKLLEILANADQSVFMSHLISQRHIASQATLHSAVKRLVAKKLVAIKTHKIDHRMRIAFLTQSSRNRFELLQRAMNHALTP